MAFKSGNKCEYNANLGSAILINRELKMREWRNVPFTDEHPVVLSRLDSI